MSLKIIFLISQPKHMLQEKESIIHVRMEQKNPSVAITVCHHSASLAIPNHDPQEGFFYPTLILMIDSYIILYYHIN